jgi:hypothetical protein
MVIQAKPTVNANKTNKTLRLKVVISVSERQWRSYQSVVTVGNLRMSPNLA